MVDRNLDRNQHNRGHPRSQLIALNCRKNPGHVNFIPINKLRLNHFPYGFRTPYWEQFIYLKGQFTVRIHCKDTSVEERRALNIPGLPFGPRQGCGTVFIHQMGVTQSCPFPNCTRQPPNHQVSGYFKLYTVPHLVLNADEAKGVEIDFFFNDQDGIEDIVKAEGVTIDHVDLKYRRSCVLCVTHDLGVYQRLASALFHLEELTSILRKRAPENNTVCVISHPHGMSKHVSFGTLLDCRKPDLPERIMEGQVKLKSCVFKYNAATCPASGGGTVLLMGSGEICKGFAPHCSTLGGMNESGLGWILEPTPVEPASSSSASPSNSGSIAASTSNSTAS